MLRYVMRTYWIDLLAFVLLKLGGQYFLHAFFLVLDSSEVTEVQVFFPE